jgi:hypothetical protein
MPEESTSFESSSEKSNPNLSKSNPDPSTPSLEKSISHELRNKIQAQMLILDVSLLRLEQLELPQLREYLQKMRRLAEEMMPYIERIPE